MVHEWGWVGARGGAVAYQCKIIPSDHGESAGGGGGARGEREQGPWRGDLKRHYHRSRHGLMPSSPPPIFCAGRWEFGGRGGGGGGPTYIHGSISVCGAAHVAGPATEQALRLIKAQHCIRGARLLEQSVYVLRGVPHPLGNQASTIDYLHINTHTPAKM